MDNDIDDVQEEINDKLVSNLGSTNIISHETVVTCGLCKKQMAYQEYDYEHRTLHYNLCWIDGVEEKLDFENTSKIQGILQKATKNCKKKLKFKCGWCDEIKLSILGYINHLKSCKHNTILEVNNTVLDDSQTSSTTSNIRNKDSMVSCGRCGESMSYEEYTNKHRHKHYNLCWLDGEEKLDYLDVNKTSLLLRAILPKYAERNKKVCFICEWCNNKKISVNGYASHVKKCAIEQKLALMNPNESNSDDELISKYDSNSTVVCGLCNKSMLYKEYENKHKLTHYNLCWINDDEKLDFDDDSRIQSILRTSLPKYAALKKQVTFICEWCKEKKKSVPGFASHIKRCQFRPDKVKLNDSNSIENDGNMVTCGRCNKEMTFKEYRSIHCSKHNNLCWIDGEEKLDLENYDDVLTKLKQFIPFKDIRNRTVKLICEDCKIVKKSVSGFASHVIFCNKTDGDINLLLINCKDCGSKVKPSSLFNHKLKSCKGVPLVKDCNKEQSSLYKLRRRKRPPNVLSFHSDTSYVTEYYDCMCRLCNFISININDIVNHIFNVHNIDINNIKNKNNLNDYILNKYDISRNIYLKPLLNYYNFFRKKFWNTVYHEDFKSDIQLLNSNEAMKYLPSVHESCKIFDSNNEKISVNLFKSVYINGMYWLFTGGPNWAMSWCPVPENVETQYLAISCHPKPDMEHKEMNTYKYPSLVQLWTFKSLKNVNFEVATVMPYMSYGIAHEFGAVWDMAWCPSGAYNPNNKIGLLALSTSCGDCPVFAMPHGDENTQMFYIYKIKPIIARNFECEWMEGGVQCKKVSWQAVSPFKTLICGYSNGTVSIFNINFKSIFLNDDILYPSHTFRASTCSITGLSMNYFNSSIVAITATDGNVTLWDLNSTESPIFQKKSHSPSDCAWLHQCYTLVYCSKSVNPIFLKVRSVNFSNCDDDFDGYNPELYVLKNVTNNSSKVISNIDVINNDDNYDTADKTIQREKVNKGDKNTILNNSHSDDDLFKSVESNTNSDEEKLNNVSKSNEEEDMYGPSFFQTSTHWSISGSNWMNIFATGNADGVVYEKLFLPETNQLKKGNSSTFQLLVRKLSNDATQSEYSNGYRFKDTVKEFVLECKLLPSDEHIQKDQDNIKPLLRYPLDNITKVSWNQNFSSFCWLASGTQSGFTLIYSSNVIPDNCIQSFYKIVTTPHIKNEYTTVQTDQSVFK